VAVLKHDHVREHLPEGEVEEEEAVQPLGVHQ